MMLAAQQYDASSFQPMLMARLLQRHFSHEDGIIGRCHHQARMLGRRPAARVSCHDAARRVRGEAASAVGRGAGDAIYRFSQKHAA